MIQQCYQCEREVHELSPRSRCVQCEYERAEFNEQENDAMRDLIANKGTGEYTGYSRYDQVLDKVRKHIEKRPHVWQAFVVKTFDYIDAGSKRESIARTFAEIRSDASVPGGGDNVFKVTNTYQPYFSRLFADAYPEYADFYEQHDMPTKRRPAHKTPDKGPKDFPAIAPEGIKI